MCECSPAMQTAFGIMQVGICLLLTAIGYAFPVWASYKDINKVYKHFGLWQYCPRGDCVPIPEALITAKTEAARVFGAMGMLACVCSMGVAAVYLLNKKRTVLLPACILSMAAFVLVLLEVILVVVWTTETTSGFGWCLGVTVSGLVQAFFGALSFYYARSRHGTLV